MRVKNLLIVALLIVLFSGCSEIKKQSKDMFSTFGMMRELTKQYKVRNISVNVLNDKEMTITFTNLPFNKIEKDNMEGKAREIALFSVGLLKEDSTIEKLSIAFIVHEKKFLIVDYTNTLGVYSFDVLELKKDLLKNTI